MTPLPPIGQRFHRILSFLTSYLYNHRKYYRLSQFNHLFDTMKTLSALWNVLIRRVEHFYNDDPNPSIDTTLCTNIITHQQKIGWNHFVRVWVHHSLIETMIERYRQKKEKYSPINRHILDKGGDRIHDCDSYHWVASSLKIKCSTQRSKVSK